MVAFRSPIRWIQNTGGAFGIGFTYHRNGQNIAILRLDSAACKNKGFAGGRNLDPDRITPNGDTWAWRF